MLQFRPRISDGPAYSPHRDIAYVFTNLAKIAFDGLAEADWEAWYGDYLRHASMTEKDISDVAAALARGIGNFCDHNIKTPGEALTKAGFFDCPSPAILAVCGKLGQVLIGAFFTCLRDTTRMEDEKPARVSDIENAAAAVQKEMDKRCYARGRMPDRPYAS